MQKIRNMLLATIMALFVVYMANIVQAASDVTLESICVTSPTSGTYKTGQELTIVATFSDEITIQTDGYVPTLQLKFGETEYYGNVSISEGTVSGDTITYTYTIKKEDAGPLTLASYIGGNIYDAQGNLVTINAPSALTGSTITANPLEWTSTQGMFYNIDDNNDLIIGMTKEEEHDYLVFITNSPEEPEIEVEASHHMIQNAEGYLGVTGKIHIEKYLERAGDIYFWICEQQKDYAVTGKYVHRFIASAVEVERPALKNLGNRIQAYFFNDETSTFLREAHDSSIERKINLKIGRVTDNSILRSIKNEEAGCLTKLLNYAKSAAAVYIGTVSLGDSASITNQFEIIDDAYYYVYMELEDVNGTYYPVEDVSLYQGLVGESVGKNLFDYLSDEFIWNLGDAEDDDTVAPSPIPQTGETMVVVAGIVTVGIVALAIGRKMKKYTF